MDQTGISDLNIALRRCLVKKLNVIEKCIDPDTSSNNILNSQSKYGITIFFEKKYKEIIKKKTYKKDFGSQTQLPFMSNTL